MKKRLVKKTRVKTFLTGFKDFIARGNIIDLAIAVIIGGAFGKITTSLVNDIVMPPIGLLIGKVDFKDLVWVIKAAEYDTADVLIKAAINIRYGAFIMVIIEFIIIAFTIYASLNLVLRRKEFLEKVKAEELAKEKLEEEEKPKKIIIPEDILLLREIRDSLKERE